jgi:NitT/TauT family transport system permease protein
MRRHWDFLLVLLALLLLWQGAHRIAGDVAIASPADAAIRLLALARTPAFAGHLAETGRALAWALLWSMLGGIVVGVVLGLNRMAGAVTEPLLVAFYALPKVTLYPLVLLLFGLGLPAKVAFGAMHGLVPVSLLTMNAIVHLRPAFLRTARVMRLGWIDVALHVVLPAVLPQLAGALRLGFSLSLLGVLIGEMFASQRGLGFLLMNAMGMNDTATIMAVAVLVGGVAVAVNQALLAVERRLPG